jgi:hypothetical protein
MIPGCDRPATRTAPIHAVTGIKGLWPRVHQSELMSDMMIKPPGCTENHWTFISQPPVITTTPVATLRRRI